MSTPGVAKLISPKTDQVLSVFDGTPRKGKYMSQLEQVATIDYGNKILRESSNQNEPNFITNYFSVENEVDRVTQQQKKGFQENYSKELLRENIRTTLEEFAGKISNSKINYFWDGYNMRAPGVIEPAAEMYKKWADETHGKREKADYEGFAAIEDGFRNGANVAFLVSPPSFGKEGFGDYGFLNIFVKKGNTIDMHLLKYQTEDENLTLSNQIHNGITTSFESPENQNETELLSTNDETVFLAKPVLLKTSDLETVLPELLSKIGFSDDPSKFKEHPFSTAVKEELHDWMEEFCNLVVQAGNSDNPEERSYFTQEAENRLKACYNKALNIKNRIDLPQIEKSYSSVDDYINSTDRPYFDSKDEEYKYYLTQDAVVLGGGSCPSGARQNGFTSTAEALLRTGGVMNYQTSDLFTKEDKTWNYENEGKCKVCKKSHDKVGKLGPCYICRGCEQKFD